MTMMPPPFRDALARFVFERGAMRGAVVSLDATRSDILACHAYPPALAHALTELCAAAALLAASLKFDGRLIVQLQGDGPVRLLVVECDARLTLRATAQWSDAVDALPAGADLVTLAGGAGRGRLAISLDPRDGGPIYQGIVALEASGIATLVEHYLAASEQIPSRLVIASDACRVRGLILQRLPGSTVGEDALWQEVASRIGAIGPEALLEAAGPADLLAAQFGDEDIRLFRPRPARFGCSCTQERVDNALRLLGADEVEGILAEQGEVRITCEFCNRAYRFAPEAARALFASARRVPSGRGAVRH